MIGAIDYNSAAGSAEALHSERLKKEKKVISDNAAQEFYDKATENQKEVESRKELIMAELKRQEEVYRKNQESRQYEQTGRLLG